MKISIIIPTFNRKETLRVLLNTLNGNKASHAIADLEIIVADDLSTDGTAEMVKENFSNVKIVFGPGKNSALNKRAAIEASAGEYIVSLDDDSLPRENWIASVLPDLERGEQLIQSKVIFLDLGQKELQDESPRYFRTGFRWIFYPLLILNGGYREQYLNNCHEFGLFIKKEVLARVPLNDPNLVSDYGESASFYLRASALGYRVFFQPKAIVDHIGVKTGGAYERELKTSPKIECTDFTRKMVHNFFIFARMSKPFRIPFLIIYYLAAGLYLTLRQRRNCFYYFYRGIIGGMTSTILPAEQYESIKV